jgi:hypothetical protein
VTLLGRFRAALGRDDASTLARARGDLRMGLGLNPPACLPPLNRAIAALERLSPRSEVTLLLARALRAKAEAVQARPARDLRVRAVAKLRTLHQTASLTAADRAAVAAALAAAWMPLQDDLRDPDLSLRQLMRAAEAQEQAMAVASAAIHLGMAEIALALGRHPLCPDGPKWLERVQRETRAARALAPDADQIALADALDAAALRAPRADGPPSFP